MSKSNGREFWTRVIQEYESRRQEQTHWDFVEEWGISLTTFRSWLYRLRREQKEVDDQVALVPVEITGLDAAAITAEPTESLAPMDAAFPGGMVLRFQVGTNPGYMAELLSSVSRRLRAPLSGQRLLTA